MATSYNGGSHPLPATPGQPSYGYPQQTPTQPYAAQQQQQQPSQYQQPPSNQADQYTSHSQYAPQAPAYQQPQQPAPTQQRPERPRPESRKSRAFSFRSDKSRRSGGADKVEYLETTEEKEAKRLHSVADPTFAMNEAEPAAVAQQESNLASLRAIQHKDLEGNPIADPDRSNPTRSRWERPLDTIRSFEAAVDGGYNRQSMYRTDTDSMANWNRRSSYYGSNGPRFPQNNYYHNRSTASFRPESAAWDRQSGMNGGGPRESYFEGYENQYNGQNGYGNRARHPRQQSEPFVGRGGPDRNVYPLPNKDRSYETVASGSGSGSMGEPAGYQTDPTSSENSSINRRSPPKRQEPVNDYGINFGQASNYQSPEFNLQTHGPPPPPAHNTPPAVPRKDGGSSLLRKSVNQSMIPDRPVAEKRKSWLARKFSKSS